MLPEGTPLLDAELEATQGELGSLVAACTAGPAAMAFCAGLGVGLLVGAWLASR
ncbi:hypothetical protein [Marinithermus hydrothermalis]|uniref:hypothetical protein n=1 Tax=Marinithermus hydrothermalis TaxID=186192 RepID=UPI000300750A|nr:hypothetical protein [Marinithermus hydrothermalis]